MMRNHDFPPRRLHSDGWKRWFFEDWQSQTTIIGSGRISALTGRR